MKILLALATKDLRILYRDKAGLFWVLAFPLMYALFFGAIFSGSGGGPRPLSVLLVDDDGTTESKAFTKRLTKSKSIKLFSTTIGIAKDQVRLGKKTAYIRLPKGFGETSSIFRGGTGPKIEVGMDPSRRAEAGYLQGILMQAWFKGVEETFANPEKTKAMIKDSLEKIGKSKELSGPS